MRVLDEFIAKARLRGAAYTSLDAMKLFAIVNMTVDHIGYYFFPHVLWWRAIGRITFPVWFFLVGYSRGRNIGGTLWLFAILLVVDRPFFDYSIFPLNALFSIILSRYFLNLCDDFKLLPDKLPLVIFLCVILVYFTAPFFEYGSIAFLYALFGRMVMRGEKKHFRLLWWASYLTFIGWQFVWFLFNSWQAVYVVFGTFFVVWWLARFSNDVLWRDWTVSRFKTFIAVLSRNTLPYYFYHRLILEILGAFMVKEGFHFVLKLH